MTVSQSDEVTRINLWIDEKVRITSEIISRVSRENYILSSDISQAEDQEGIRRPV